MLHGVLWFHKLVANFNGGNAATLQGMTGSTWTVGLTFGLWQLWHASVDSTWVPWSTRLGYQISSASGCKQPGVSTLVLPHLTLKQAKPADISKAITLEHYAGPNKVIPPAVTINTITVLDRPVWWMAKRRTQTLVQQLEPKQLWSGIAPIVSSPGNKVYPDLPTHILYFNGCVSFLSRHNTQR